MALPALELIELRFELEASGDPDLLAKVIDRHGGNVQPPCREAGLRFGDPNDAHAQRSGFGPAAGELSRAAVRPTRNCSSESSLGSMPRASSIARRA